MKVVTGNQMKQIDKTFIEEMGLPSIVLMERAGLAVFNFLKQEIKVLKKHKIIILAGSGNNGGDALVVARHLLDEGCFVDVFLIGSKDKLSCDNKTNLNILKNLGFGVKFINKITDLDYFISELSTATLLLDGLFGTGLNTPIKGLAAKIIDKINVSRCIKVAIDIPTGIDSTTGQVQGIAIFSNYTVTFGLPKLGHFLYPGSDYCGALRVVNIGFPGSLLQNKKNKFNLVDKESVKLILPSRPWQAHKGSCGKVLVVGGSAGFTGAAALASQSALRMGAGLVTLAIPESLNRLMEVKLTEVITQPLPETPDQTLSIKAKRKILERISEFDVLVLGPGLGRTKETQQLIIELIQTADIPKVVDADALYALTRSSKIKSKPPWILTPHPVEFARIVKLEIDKVHKNIISLLLKTADKFKADIVFKKAYSLIATTRSEIFINPTGNPALATAGTGDVLTGMIAGLAAQGVSLSQAGIAATYLHGLLADEFIKSFATETLIASDLINLMPKVLREFHES